MRKHASRFLFLAAFLFCSANAQTAAPPDAPVRLHFHFGSATAPAGYTHVESDSVYSDAAGFGFDAQPESGDSFFSAKVPEGNYTVTLRFQSPVADSVTVKAESGRLMLERLALPAGKVVERSFTTNVRTPKLPKLPLNATGREEVSLDQFDRGNTQDWDDKLTIEVLGPQSALRSIEIAAVPDAPTVFLAGDSTVTDRNSGQDVSWGQLLPRFLKPGVAVANHAQSGETLKSFANALRLDKILSQMKKGDFLFIQFAHNDSKATWPQTYADAETTYKAYLKVYIAEARLRGATPVLVTAMDRGVRGTGAPTHGHGQYPEAVREVAREDHVALIDLYAMSIAFYDAAGADAPKILADGTHSTAYGGYEFAKCIVMGIRQSHLDLARFVVDDFKDFDPAHPDGLYALHLDGLFQAGAGRPAPRTTGSPGPGPL